MQTCEHTQAEETTIFLSKFNFHYKLQIRNPLSPKQDRKLAQQVETGNMVQSHEYIREVEPAVFEMSEHSLPNKVHPPVVKLI